MIASDGVWDVMSSAEVVGFILQCKDPKEAAEKLAKEARGRWEELTLNKKVGLSIFVVNNKKDEQQNW